MKQALDLIKRAQENKQFQKFERFSIIPVAIGAAVVVLITILLKTAPHVFDAAWTRILAAMVPCVLVAPFAIVALFYIAAGIIILLSAPSEHARLKAIRAKEQLDNAKDVQGE